MYGEGSKDNIGEGLGEVVVTTIHIPNDTCGQLKPGDMNDENLDLHPDKGKDRDPDNSLSFNVDNSGMEIIPKVNKLSISISRRQINMKKTFSSSTHNYNSCKSGNNSNKNTKNICRVCYESEETNINTNNNSTLTIVISLFLLVNVKGQ